MELMEEISIQTQKDHIFIKHIFSLLQLYYFCFLNHFIYYSKTYIKKNRKQNLTFKSFIFRVLVRYLSLNFGANPVLRESHMSY